MKWEIDSSWVQAYDAFLAKYDPSSAPAGQCFEVTIGEDPQLWAAYNPHGVKTPTTRTHDLDPSLLVVEVDGLQSSIMGPSGGTDLDREHGPDAADLKTTFDTGTVTGFVPTPTQAIFKASSKMIEDEKAITADTTWETVAGVVTTIGFFLPDTTYAVGRVVGQVKTVGEGVQLRLVRDSDGTALNFNAFEPGDTGDVWQAMQFSTDQDPGGATDLYRLEARLNGATSASLRYVSMSLLEVY